MITTTAVTGNAIASAFVSPRHWKLNSVLHEKDFLTSYNSMTLMMLTLLCQSVMSCTIWEISRQNQRLASLLTK